MIADFGIALDEFMSRVQSETNMRLIDRKLDCPGNMVKVAADYGKRFVRIVFVTGEGGHRSVRYFVEQSTGIIFAAQGWKQYNPKRSYGTLDTIDQFSWGDYQGVAKSDSAFIMKPTLGGYATAVPKAANI